MFPYTVRGKSFFCFYSGLIDGHKGVHPQFLRDFLRITPHQNFLEKPFFCVIIKNMKKQQYHNFIMWKSSNPTQREPSSLTAYMTANSLSTSDIEAFMNHESYSLDLLRATRFYLVNELPDMMWTLYSKAKTKQKAQDISALLDVVYSDKYAKVEEKEDIAQLEEKLTDEQRDQILQRALKKKNNETNK
jgi:hypothetical protein